MVVGKLGTFYQIGFITLDKLLILLIIISSFSVIAGEADVLEEKLLPAGEDRWRVQVTIQHADQGWDHYADGFQVLTYAGVLLADRELLHPHVNEQPFTRSTQTFAIPAGVSELIVRAHDSVHGQGGEVRLTLPSED